jgi:hypothetical protein
MQNGIKALGCHVVKSRIKFLHAQSCAQGLQGIRSRVFRMILETRCTIVKSRSFTSLEFRDFQGNPRHCGIPEHKYLQ